MSTPSDPITPRVGDPVGTPSTGIGEPVIGAPVTGNLEGDTGAGTSGTGQKAQETASAVADEGKAVVGTMSEQARSVADTAKTQVSSVSQEAKTQAQRVVGDAKSELQSQVEQRVSDIAGKARTTSEQLRALADGRTEEAGPATDWVRQASDRLDQFSSRIDDMGLQGATQEVTRFARQRPMVFLAGAAAAGFLLGRTFRNASSGGSSQGQATMPVQGQIPPAYTTPDLDFTDRPQQEVPTWVGADTGSMETRQTTSVSSPTGEFG